MKGRNGLSGSNSPWSPFCLYLHFLFKAYIYIVYQYVDIAFLHFKLEVCELCEHELPGSIISLLGRPWVFFGCCISTLYQRLNIFTKTRSKIPNSAWLWGRRLSRHPSNCIRITMDREREACHGWWWWWHAPINPTSSRQNIFQVWLIAVTLNLSSMMT